MKTFLLATLFFVIASSANIVVPAAMVAAWQTVRSEASIPTGLSRVVSAGYDNVTFLGYDNGFTRRTAFVNSDLGVLTTDELCRAVWCS